MKVLLLGSGGREHAMAWALARSTRFAKLWALPGNAGTVEFGENVRGVSASDPAAVAGLARRLRPDLVVIGPEEPLCAGVGDRLEAEGFAVFGPSAAAAEIESSKAYAKGLMRRAGIATARASSFGRESDALSHLRRTLPDWAENGIVVKADGLAAGKGVTVCEDLAEAEAAVTEAFGGAFGPAGDTVLLEERMRGRETSAHAFTDGRSVRHMPFSCDHKPVLDGNRGPNTGGMGCYSPPGWLDVAAAGVIRREVTERAVRQLADEGRPFRGVLYPGMMITGRGPRVVEFNCRFGDPETEVLLPRLRTDFLDVSAAVARGRLDELDLEWDERATVGVVMVSPGYPGSYPRGAEIEGLDAVDPGVEVFLAGARRERDRVLTDGGRVLCVVAAGDTLAEARSLAYENVGRISFDGAHYRSDIALGAGPESPVAPSERGSRAPCKSPKLEAQAR